MQTTRAAPLHGPVSETRDAARDAGGPQPSAAEGQYFRRHPADLRFVAAADAAYRHPDDGNRVAGESAWGDFLILLNQYLAHGQPLYMALYGGETGRAHV